MSSKKSSSYGLSYNVTGAFIHGQTCFEFCDVVPAIGSLKLDLQSFTPHYDWDSASLDKVFPSRIPPQVSLTVDLMQVE